MNPRLRTWEIAGICVAVAIGTAVGAAYMLADAIDRLILGDDSEWPTVVGIAPR